MGTFNVKKTPLKFHTKYPYVERCFYITFKCLIALAHILVFETPNWTRNPVCVVAFHCRMMSVLRRGLKFQKYRVLREFLPAIHGTFLDKTVGAWYFIDFSRNFDEWHLLMAPLNWRHVVTSEISTNQASVLWTFFVICRHSLYTN